MANPGMWLKNDTPRDTLQKRDVCPPGLVSNGYGAVRYTSTGWPCTGRGPAAGAARKRLARLAGRRVVG